MSSTTILSDNGVSSGSAGVKTTGGNDGTLLLQTTTSGGTATTAVTIDNAQNVGIGVTPSAWSSNFKAFQLGASGYNIAITAQGNADAMQLWSNAYIDSGNTERYIASRSAGKQVNNGNSFSWSIAPSGTAGGAITWTQAMTLDASGHLGIGTTSIDSGAIVTVQAASGGNGMAVKAGTNGNYGIYFNNVANSTVGGIIINSGAVAYNTTVSDYRLKDNVSNLNNAISAVGNLRPVSFTWKDTNQTDIGFIAHELQQVVPECVTGEKDAVNEDGSAKYQSVFPAPAQMIALLTAAIQELTARVQALEGAK